MREARRSAIDILFTLALFCVFCASALAVVVIGANVYTTTAHNMQQNFSTRSALSYLTEKLHQSDVAGTVSLGEVEGTEALILTEAQAGGSYNTYIYSYNGAVRELLLPAGATPQLAAGQTVADAKTLTFADLGGGLLQATVTTADGDTQQVLLALRSGPVEGGVQP